MLKDSPFDGQVPTLNHNQPQDQADEGEGTDRIAQSKASNAGNDEEKKTDRLDKPDGVKSSKDVFNKSDLFDADKNAATVKGIKDDAAYKKEKEQDKHAAEDAWKRAVSDVKTANFSQLEDDLYYAISDQLGISKSMDSTYDHGGDPVYADSDFLMPQDDFEEKKIRPVIYVFFDQSGSFGESTIRRGLGVLKVLDDFIQDGRIAQPKCYVFANEVTELENRHQTFLGTGTGGWAKCMQIIKESQNLPPNERCNNVIVISDHDIERQTGWGVKFDPTRFDRCWNEVIEIQGCVFWCWADGKREPNCEKYLKGEADNFAYTF